MPARCGVRALKSLLFFSALCVPLAPLMWLGFTLSSLSLWGVPSLLDSAGHEPQTNFSHILNESWRGPICLPLGHWDPLQCLWKPLSRKEIAHIEIQQFVWLKGRLCIAFWERLQWRHRSRYDITHSNVCNNVIVYRVPFNKASKWFQYLQDRKKAHGKAILYKGTVDFFNRLC